MLSAAKVRLVRRQSPLYDQPRRDTPRERTIRKVMMSTAELKSMTAHGFFTWVHQVENRDRVFELDRGEIIEMPPPGKHHGFVCGNVARLLGVFACTRKRGNVCTNDSGLLVARHPDTVRGMSRSMTMPNRPEKWKCPAAARPFGSPVARTWSIARSCTALRLSAGTSRHSRRRGSQTSGPESRSEPAGRILCPAAPRWPSPAH